jgi:alpha-1,2-glucosyltransferase
MPSMLQTWALPVALMGIVAITVTWYNQVSHQVPAPYLVSLESIVMTSG